MLKHIALFALIAAITQTRENNNVISLYQRPIIPINPNTNTFPLYVGLTKDHNISAVKLPFKLDLNYGHTLITDKITCADLGYCTGDSTKVQTDTYNGKQYNYIEVESLLAPQVISPAEIDAAEAQSVSRSKLRLVQDDAEGLSNVLGLAPNAEVWEEWNNEYFLRNETLNVTYHKYPGYDYMMFYSKIGKSDPLVDVKKEDKYLFNAKFSDGGSSKDAKVCVKTDKNVLFELNDELYNRVLGLICKNGSQCKTKADLKSNLGGEVGITLTEPANNKSFTADYNVDDLFDFAEDNNTIVLNFSRNTDPGFSECDVVLQNMFFQKYYLLISNNIKDAKNVRVGLRKVHLSDFFMRNLWRYLLILTIVVLGVIIVIFALRGCKKPQDVDGDYTTLPLAQTNKDKSE